MGGCVCVGGWISEWARVGVDRCRVGLSGWVSECGCGWVGASVWCLPRTCRWSADVWGVGFFWGGVDGWMWVGDSVGYG